MRSLACKMTAQHLNNVYTVYSMYSQYNVSNVRTVHTVQNVHRVHTSSHMYKGINHRQPSKLCCIKDCFFDFEVSKERLEALIAQIRMHAALNKILEENGFRPLPNSKMAIEDAKSKGLIEDITYKQCLFINKNGNNAKHKWCDK